jgi:GT2 family glycosyltransferase
MPMEPTPASLLDLPSVAVTIVTFNSARFIRRCLESVLDQNYRQLESVVVDNASNDGTVEILEAFNDQCRVICNRNNAGFAGGQNQAIGYTRADWVLTLNPDVLLMPGFIQSLVWAGEADPHVGTVCGKLRSMSPDYVLPEKPLIDSTGIYFTPALRHLDRGNRLPDNGQYEQFEFVFGATAAAALYRREAINDISIDGEFFDNDFFAYREDADVAWRAQLFGWRCVYTPHALAYHVRTVIPENRRAYSAAINMHSVKNRWMMRIKNITPALYRHHFRSIVARDLLVVAACFAREFRSLRGYGIVARKWGSLRRKRAQIMKKRRANDADLARWFSFSPVSFPAPRIADSVLAREAEAAAQGSTVESRPPAG